MRITDVVVNRFSMGPLENAFHNSNSRSVFSEKGFAFVEVHTDEGVTGIAPTYARQVARPANIARLKPLIVGEDPVNAARLWSKMYPAADVGAIDAIDNALWDLRGKIFGQHRAEPAADQCHAAAWLGEQPDGLLELSRREPGEA